MNAKTYLSVTEKPPRWKAYYWIDRLILRLRPHLADEVYRAWSAEQKERDYFAARYLGPDADKSIYDAAAHAAIARYHAVKGNLVHTPEGRDLLQAMDEILTQDRKTLNLVEMIQDHHQEV